jgi:hypothetical protein
MLLQARPLSCLVYFLSVYVYRSIHRNAFNKQRPLKYVDVDYTCVCCRSLKPAQLFESGVPSVLKGVRVRVWVRIELGLEFGLRLGLAGSCNNRNERNRTEQS